jgi:hypothetical protein
MAFESDSADFDVATGQNKQSIEVTTEQKTPALEERNWVERSQLIDTSNHLAEKNDRCSHSEGTVREYSQAAVKLVIRRRQLASLLQQRRFIEAAQVQCAVMKLDEVEKQSSRRLMQYGHSEVVKQFMAKHEEELTAFHRSAALRRAQLRQ